MTGTVSFRKSAGDRPLVLTVERLARRGGSIDVARTASYLGGSSWLVRVWKRNALRAPAVLSAARRVIDAALSLPRKVYARLNLVIVWAGVFRSVSMSFQF